MEDFIKFCKRLELNKSIYNTTHAKTGQKTNTQKSNGLNSLLKTGKSNLQSGQKQKAAQYYCLYHGENNTHKTDNCKVLKAQAERMASTQASQNAGKYKNYRAKTEMPSSKDFQSFATDIIEKVIKKMKKAQNEDKAKENFSFNKF